ncbi:MAG: hypothetical protein R3E95_17335 [Thiolinea sp.]
MPDPENRQEAAANRNLIQAATLEELLPHYQQDQRPPAHLFRPQDCYQADTPAASSRQASVISLLAIDLDQPGQAPAGRCFIGDMDTSMPRCNPCIWSPVAPNTRRPV